MDTPLEARSAQQLNCYKRLTAARLRLLASVAGLDDRTLCGEPVFATWTAADLVGHCVAWNKELRDEIEIICRGGHPAREKQISGADDFDAWNQARIAEKRAHSWRDTLAEVEQDYAEAVELIMRLQPRDFRRRGMTPWRQPADEPHAVPTIANTQSVETLLSFHWRHMNGHAGHIEKWRRKRGV